MRTFLDAKAMAKSLRSALSESKVMQVGDPFGNKLRFSESNAPGPRP